MEIHVKKFWGDPYKEVTITTSTTKIELGILNEKECRSLAFELRSAAAQLLPENEDLESQLATATDKLNSWAREQGVEECKDPYKNYQLRDLVDRLWDKISQNF